MDRSRKMFSVATVRRVGWMEARLKVQRLERQDRRL